MIKSEQNDKINILFTSYTGFPSPDFGGPNKVIYEIIKKIDFERFNVNFLSKHLLLQSVNTNKSSSDNFNPGFKNRISKWFFQKSSFYKKIVSHPLFLDFHFRKNNRFFKNFNLEGNNYNLIHAHDIRSIYHQLRNVSGKTILTIHSKGSIKTDLMNYVKPNIHWFKRLVEFEEMENEVVSSANRIIFPSYSAREFFLASKKNIHFDELKFSVIYNGIDLDYIRSVKPDQDLIKKFNLNQSWELVIINIADHIRDKRVEKVIDVIGKIKNKYKIKVLFINVGSGMHTRSLLNKVSDLKLKNNVVFAGNIDNKSVIRLIKWSDIMLQLSINVVFDYSILEALSCGKIVVASNEGGNREIIENNKSGYLVDDIASDEIANLILDVNRQIGVNVESTVKNFSNDIMVKNYQKLYLSLAR
jgi:glycosyltransferase involved in cell wall biosynthesis